MGNYCFVATGLYTAADIASGCTPHTCLHNCTQSRVPWKADLNMHIYYFQLSTSRGMLAGRKCHGKSAHTYQSVGRRSM